MCQRAKQPDRPAPMRGLCLVVGVALAARLALFVVNLDHPQRWFTPDSTQYDRLARNLLARGAFSLSAAPPYGPTGQVKSEPSRAMLDDRI